MLNSKGERELAYIVEVNRVDPIPGYDRIEVATIDGWHCVVGKGMQPGDKAVYFEIDSLLPAADERFKFCEKYKYRIKTQRMCKGAVLSQGLLMPISEFPELANLNVGDGVTELLGVKYYEPEDNKRKAAPADKYKKMAQRHGKLFAKQPFRWLMRREWGKKLLFVFFGKKKDKLGWPEWVKRTDEERLQGCPYILKEDTRWTPTEKVDGCLDGKVSVVTDAGIIRIANIVNQKMDVNVLTYNETTRQCEYKPIVDYYRWERVSDMYDVVVEQRGYRCGNRAKHIKCTSEHSFYIGNGQYIKAKDLTVDNIIYHRAFAIDSFSKEILLGILLGDGSLGSKHGIINGSVDFCHSINQSDYLYETARILGSGNSHVTKRTSGYGSEILACHYRTNPEFKEFVLANCQRDSKKHITKEWVDELTPVSLAFWYMDDGSICNADNANVRPTINISTNGFSYEECELLVEMLRNKFNITAEIRTKASYKGNVLYLNTENTDKFTTLIAPYICASMKYKLPAYLRSIKYCLADYTVSEICSIVPTKIVSIQKLDDYKRGVVFDLNVADNHNYFANGVLTHNSSATFTMRRGKHRWSEPEYIVASRNVPFRTGKEACYYDTNIYTEIADKYHMYDVLSDLLRSHPKEEWVTIQGEIYGPSVQKRTYGLDERRLAAFNLVWSTRGRVGTLEMRDTLASYDIPTVPILGVDIELPEDVDEVLKLSDGKSYYDGGMREGIVYRSADGKQSFKAVSNEYLLKYH